MRWKVAAKLLLCGGPDGRRQCCKRAGWRSESTQPCQYRVALPVDVVQNPAKLEEAQQIQVKSHLAWVKAGILFFYSRTYRKKRKTYLEKIHTTL
jgi:hypothetical protein